VYSGFGGVHNKSFQFIFESRRCNLRSLLRVVATCFTQSCARTSFCGSALLVSLLALPLHCQNQQAVDASSTLVSGMVLSSVTREPLGRAMVYSLNEQYATFTDDHGRFELNLTAPVTAAGAKVQIVLDVRKPGFRSRGSNLIHAGQDDVTLWLVPEGIISGRVKFPSDEPGDHVDVQLYHREIRDGVAQWLPASRDRTRVDGEFRFADLVAGEYKVFTLENMEQGQPESGSNEPPWGFPPRFFPAARDFGSAETIHLRAGETFLANITLERQRYYDVRVPVVGNEEGMPPGMRVSVYAQGHRGPGFELGFNRAQQMITGMLPNGTYTIEATGYGPHAATGSTSITVANRAAVGLPLAIATNPSIEITIGKDLSGADSTAKQVAATSSRVPAQVSLLSAEDVDGGRGRAYYSQGNPLMLNAVEPGRYWVAVRAFGGYAATVASDGKDLLREPLVVPYGASVPPIEVTLRYDTGELEAVIEGAEVSSAGSPGNVMGSVPRSPGNVVMGIVTNPSVIAGGSGRTDSMMQGGLSVYCIPLDGSHLLPDSGQMNVMNGQTRWSQLPPGEYRVLAFTSPKDLEYRNPVALKAYDSQGQVVTVLPGQKAQVTVRVIRDE